MKGDVSILKLKRQGDEHLAFHSWNLALQALSGAAPVPLAGASALQAWPFWPGSHLCAALFLPNVLLDVGRL